MSRRVIYRDFATNDLADIIGYLAERNPSAAMKVKAAILDLANDLLIFPGRGATVEQQSLAPELHRVIVPRYRNYLVYYTVSDVAITIVRILHSSRNQSTELKESGDL